VHTPEVSYARSGDVAIAYQVVGAGPHDLVFVRGTTGDLPLTWSGGRWNVSLDTSSLTASCYTVTATIGDLVAGSFTLELRDGDAVKALPKRNGVTAPVTTTSTDRRSKTNTKPH